MIYASLVKLEISTTIYLTRNSITKKENTSKKLMRRTNNMNFGSIYKTGETTNNIYNFFMLYFALLVKWHFPT